MRKTRFLLVRLRGLLLILKNYDNWPLVVLDHLHVIAKKEVIYKLNNGLRIFIRTKDVDRQLVNTLIIGKEYNPKGFEIKEKDIVIDIGAHIGIFSLFAARQARKGKVLAYEPSSQNFSLLQRNIKLNKANNVIAYRSAVSKHNNKIRLYLSDYAVLFNIFDRSLEYEEVQSTTLVNIFKRNNLARCNFLKIDCEGAEYEILMTTSSLTLKKIDKIVFEYHERKGVELGDLLDFLENNSFEIIYNKPYPEKKIGLIFAKRKSY
jgi:FkbM family methyltransferase